MAQTYPIDELAESWLQLDADVAEAAAAGDEDEVACWHEVREGVENALAASRPNNYADAGALLTIAGAIVADDREDVDIAADMIEAAREFLRRQHAARGLLRRREGRFLGAAASDPRLTIELHAAALLVRRCWPAASAFLMDEFDPPAGGRPSRVELVRDARRARRLRRIAELVAAEGSSARDRVDATHQSVRRYRRERWPDDRLRDMPPLHRGLADLVAFDLLIEHDAAITRAVVERALAARG